LRPCCPKALEKPEDKKARQKKAHPAVTREEIYSTVDINSRLHRDYILMDDTLTRYDWERTAR